MKKNSNRQGTLAFINLSRINNLENNKYILKHEKYLYQTHPINQIKELLTLIDTTSRFNFITFNFCTTTKKGNETSPWMAAMTSLVAFDLDISKRQGSCSVE